MTIVVCPLSKVEQMIRVHAPERVVSLLDPEFDFPGLGATSRERHLRRNGRMARAMEETGRDLRWERVDENVPFESPSTF